jgi:hypothetical protein
MAKEAKSVDVEVTERMTSKFVKDILAHFANIESARGVYMNKARREKEGMTAIYEDMAVRGVSQKSAKTEIKIILALEKIKGWVADLEADERKMVEKLAKAQGDKRQLLLFGELPPIPKPPKEPKEPKAKKEKAEKSPAPDLGTVETIGAA